MKTKKMSHLSISVIIIFSLALSACGKNATTTNETIVNRSAENQLSTFANTQSSYEAWSKLLLSDEKNVALAEILAKSVANENKKLVQDLVSSLSNEEIESIIAQITSEKNALNKSFLFRQNNQLEGTDLFRNSILEEDFKISDSEANQMTIATFSYLKSKSLEEIYKSFNDVIEKNSKDVAQALIQDIALNNPALAVEIESAANDSFNAEEFSKKLIKSKAYLEKADEYFKYSGLNTKEQLVLVATGTVGAVIYSELKNNKTFISLLNHYKKIKLVILEVKEKVELIKLSVEVIKNDRDLIVASFKDFNAGLSGVKDGIKESTDRINDDSSVDSKKTAQFLYDKIIRGKPLNKNETNPSLLDSQKKITENLAKSFAAAGTMANSLQSIINVTNMLSDNLGIKLPSNVQKALNTATKVAAGVKLASAVVSGFMSGGVLTAVGMLSSGPLGDMLGMSSGTDPQVMAALGRIEAKLDVVLENQQKMLDLQIETIKAIKNLAVMVDEYHQKEMIALAGLHDDNMISMELSRAKLNANIRRCESLIDFELKKFWGKDKRNSFNGSITANIDYETFYKGFKSMNDFRKFARGATENDYTHCQDALSEAFGNTDTINNPILSIFNSEDDLNLFSFQRDTYKPLVKMLAQTKKNLGERKKILHIPMSKISDLDYKNDSLSSSEIDTLSTDNEFDYNLDNLLSTKSLERYFSSYIILYPIFEFDKNDWNLSLQELVTIYYKNMIPSEGIFTEQNTLQNVSRSYFFMSNAIDLIQSAIAQEAILAGESLIPTIRMNLGSSILTNEECNTKIICAKIITSEIFFADIIYNIVIAL
jgi:hypothetical protein